MKSRSQPKKEKKRKGKVDKIQNEKKSRRFTDRADVSDASHLLK